MPLEKLTAFTKKVQDLADKPNGTMSAAEVKAQFDAAPDEVRLYLNTLIDDLSSVVDGDSGADNVAVTAIAGLAGVSVQSVLEALKVLIDSKSPSTDVFNKLTLQSVADGTSGADLIGATPIATSPATVQGILEWLKLQIDSTVLGQIPDGSVTPVKLSFDPATQIELDEHKAEDTAHEIGDKTALLTTDKTTIVSAMNELFTNANNGKTDIASVIGSPATSGDTFTQLKTHIQTSKNDLATNLTAKGQSSVGTETLDALVDKVALVATGKKWASGTTTILTGDFAFTLHSGSTYNFKKVSVTGLDFTPTTVMVFQTNNLVSPAMYRL